MQYSFVLIQAKSATELYEILQRAYGLKLDFLLDKSFKDCGDHVRDVGECGRERDNVFVRISELV